VSASSETRLYPHLHHVGIVVRDLEAAGHDDSAWFGLGDVVGRFTLHAERARYRGDEVTFAAEFGFLDLGNTQLELIQPVGSDQSPYLDALHEHGEQIHHLAFVVPSIERHVETARAANPNVAVVFDTDIPGGRFVYVEGMIHGTLIELIEFTGSQS
jgi:catechol 2,3-dioxygenase-like lactoylglutathione lyase family enzyme